MSEHVHTPERAEQERLIASAARTIVCGDTGVPRELAIGRCVDAVKRSTDPYVVWLASRALQECTPEEHDAAMGRVIRPRFGRNLHVAEPFRGIINGWDPLGGGSAA